jgi:hypothetical protein
MGSPPPYSQSRYIHSYSSKGAPAENNWRRTLKTPSERNELMTSTLIMKATRKYYNNRHKDFKVKLFVHF